MIKKVGMIVKYSVLGYFIGEGFSNVFKNKKSTGASLMIMCATMIIFGIFLILGENINHFVDQVKSEQGFQVFLKTDATDEEVSEESGGKYKSLSEAIDRINELEAQLEQYQNSDSADSSTIAELQAEVAALIPAAERLCAVPDELRVQVVIGDVVAVAEAGAELRTAVFDTGVVIGALRHIDAPDAAGGLILRGRKARRLAVEFWRQLTEQHRRQMIEPRNLEQLEDGFSYRPRMLLHIAVDGLQRLVLGHDGLQGLVGSDAGQNLTFQMELFFFRRVQMH